MALAPPTNGTGPNLWEMSAQGSDHTAQPSEPQNVMSPPEGIVYASAGVTAADFLGRMYIKTTDVTLNTGWCLVSCSGPRQ